MKKLMTLGLLATSFAFADQGSEITSLMKAPTFEVEAAPVTASYGYYCVGIGPLPLPAPLVGVGGRYQNGHHGFDGSLQVSTTLKVSLAKVNANYLYYFKPNLDSQWYMGAGVGLMRPLLTGRHLYRDTPWMYVSPQLIVGKQYTTKHGSIASFPSGD